MAVTSDVGDRARSRGVSYQELLDRDTRAVPKTLRLVQPIDFESDDIPTDRYTSREFHELEKAKLWSRSWQMVCRDEHLPDPGDTYVYDIAGSSYLIVRITPTLVKAYPNACLHRGRLLRESSGPAEELRCPFHGFCWDLDGALKEVPCAWDFPSVEPETWALPEVSVGLWGGFIFINPDPTAPPFEEYVGDLDRHFERWPLEKRYVEAHVAKVMRCNWKACQEAFMESFHVITTHPNLLPGIGDANSQYDVFGNFSRAITPNGTPSPHLTWSPSEQEMLDAMIDRRLDDPMVMAVPEGETARSVAASGARAQLAPTLGEEYMDSLCDAELVDSFYYTLFPNFHPWGGFNRIVYRFRPNGDDHTTSIMECMFLSPYNGERPPPAPVHHLGPDDNWTDAPELGMLARVFEQDSLNLPKVQAGLQAMKKPGVTFAHYQETKIRHFYRMLDDLLKRP